MKKLLLIILCVFFSLHLFSQNKPVQSTFLNCEFGKSKTECVRTLKNNGYNVDNPDKSSSIITRPFGRSITIGNYSFDEVTFFYNHLDELMYVVMTTSSTYSYDYAYSNFYSLFKHLYDLYPLEETPPQFTLPVTLESYTYMDFVADRMVTIEFQKIEGRYSTSLSYFSNKYVSKDKDKKEEF